jgi:HEPN domain-containing protein
LPAGAVEKSLKAFLIYQNVDIEKTHDVLFLLSECAKFDPIFNTIDPLNINAFAVQARYPNFNMPEAEEARALYKLAVLVSKIVKDRIVLP